MKKINRAAMYLLLKSKDTIINLAVLAVLAIAMSSALAMGFFPSKGRSGALLIVYVFTLGMTLIVGNSMMIDLTVKDKLSHRTEFFLASGIRYQDIVFSYSLQMLRISSIIPFFTFLAMYYFIDFEYNEHFVTVMYVSTVFLAFAEIFFLNVYSLTAKKYKLFKNIVFFGTFFLIYLMGTYSEKILQMIGHLKIDILFFIIGLNLLIGLNLGIFALIKCKTMDREEIIQQQGEWV